MSCCRSSTGRLFHSRGPATPKLLSPSLDCVRGTVHVWTSSGAFTGTLPWLDFVVFSRRVLAASEPVAYRLVY